MKGYCHRETKAYLFQNRQTAGNHMCDLLLLISSLHIKQAETKKKQKKRHSRKVQGMTPTDPKRTVIVYDGTSLKKVQRYSSIRTASIYEIGQYSFYTERVQRALAQRTTVIPVSGRRKFL